MYSVPHTSTRRILRQFSPSIIRLEEADEEALAAKEAADLALAKEAAKTLAKEAAADINSKIVGYKKQVSILRKEYASEVALQRAADQAEIAAKQKEEKRRKLERSRLQNIKAAESSVRELERRRHRELEFEDELRFAQVNRDGRNERFRKARQLLINELEEEAPLWLTTHEEVEAAFTKNSEQELWVLPNSIIGAPAPSDDAKFWNQESHTWHLEKTYQTQREALVEELVERAYDDANIDRSYWTPERLQERKALEEKAKLRAMVREAGRRSLLLKQKELLQDRFPQEKHDGLTIPRPMPVPNVKLLGNEEAMEMEGADVLFKDPARFFEFDKQPDNDDTGSKKYGDEYDGPTLGVPRGLKDNVRVEKTLNKAYPDVLGKMPKPDSRTAKEKKREERERAMMAAAKKDDVDLEEETDSLDDIEAEELDLDNIVYEEDEEWEEGLDPDMDKDLLSLPRKERYSEDDIDAVVERLEKKLLHLEEELDYEIDLARQQLDAGMESAQDSKQFSAPVVEDEAKEQFSVEAGDKVFNVESLGVDPQDVSKILESLNDEQMVALHTIDRETDASLGAEELRKKLSEVPGLTAEQIDAIVGLEETLSSHEDLRGDEEFVNFQAEFDALADDDEDEGDDDKKD